MEAKSKINVEAIIAESRKHMAEVRALKAEDLSHFTQEQLDTLGNDLELLKAYAKKVKANLK